MLKNIYPLIFLLLAVFSGCKVEKNNIGPALESITTDGIKAHLSVIASDEFQGRAPATIGEEKTIAYLAEQFRKLGLKPANNQSYFQEVSLIKLTPDKSMNLDFSGGKNKVSLKYHDDFIGSTSKVSDFINIENSEVVFVGYGINSPENSWNDYAGIDVKGKTVLMLVNDPGYSTGDSTLFSGKTMTAALLEIAEAFTKLPEKQNRSILFLSVTCEEQGLLGSEYYVKHPLFPLAKTAGEINMDALNIFGKTKDMTIVGYGNSQLDSLAETVLKKYGRYAIPDPTPEKGGYFRSDHFSFAKVGVPSLDLSQGVDNVEHGKEWGLARQEKWIMENYHKPSDNYEPDKWDFDGLIADVKVYFEVGYDLSISNQFPKWSRGFQFKPLRDKMMEDSLRKN